LVEARHPVAVRSLDQAVVLEVAAASEAAEEASAEAVLEEDPLVEESPTTTLVLADRVGDCRFGKQAQ